MKFFIYLVLTSALILVGGLFSRWLGPHESDPDQQVIDQLKKAGSNLRKPHNIEFFLYFKTEKVAKSAADEVRKEVSSVKLQLGADGKDWLCFAIKEMIPKHSELVRLRKRFNDIAHKFDGEYDGWGTAIVE